MSSIETIFRQMKCNVAYSAKELAELTKKPLPAIYHAMRDIGDNQVIERIKVKPEKGRSYIAFISHQQSVF